MAGKSFRAIIFDMDGVLVNTEPHHIIIEKRLFAGLNLQISQDEHRSYLGKSSSRMWQEIIARYNLPYTADELSKRNSQEIISYFSALETIEIMPGIPELLKAICQMGMPMALASSSDQATIDILLNRSGLEKYFKYKVSSETVGRSKPEPDVYLHTAILMNVNPDECLVVEDSPNGICAAKSAGMYCIAYRGDVSEQVDQSLADEIIEDFFELNAIIQKFS